MASMTDHYNTLPDGVRAEDTRTPGKRRAARPWYRDRSLYDGAARVTIVGATATAAWVSLALHVFGK